MDKKTFSLRGGSLGWIKGGVQSSYEDANIIVLEGGGDWNPTLYKQKPNSHVRYWDDTRDAQEMRLIQEATRDGKIIFGICRGIQGLTIHNGGTLVQHISHPGTHVVKDFKGEHYYFNSCHHQMCNPFNLPDDDYRVLAWCDGLSPMYKGEKEMPVHMPIEPEVLFFPKTRHLGAQGHPEWMQDSSPAVQRMNDYIEQLLLTNTIV